MRRREIPFRLLSFDLEYSDYEALGPENLEDLAKARRESKEAHSAMDEMLDRIVWDAPKDDVPTRLVLDDSEGPA